MARLKAKHFRHPIRTLAAAKNLFAAHVNMRILGARGEARFRNDPRYGLRSLRDGFASRLNVSDDSAILQRICNAYIRAVQREPSVRSAYQPTRWWNEIRQRSLAPVRRALTSRDIAALNAMYRNFFRDPCSTGLIGVPPKMGGAYLGAPVDDRYSRLFLSNALHRVDYWREVTGDHFALRDLAGPDVGNPFGVSIEGVLIRSGTEPQHYFAQRIADLLPTGRAIVAEIGGGFGGMAYYLLRDRPEISYCNFDVPESIALASYYLLKSFPHWKFLLYGEDELSAAPLGRYNAILLPTFEIESVPPKSVDLTFSSHTLSDLERSCMGEYLEHIVRITRKSFLYVGRSAESRPVQTLIRHGYPRFKLSGERPLEWNKQKLLNDNEVECLYQISRS